MSNFAVFSKKFHSLQILALIYNASAPFIIDLDSAQMIESSLPKVICNKVVRDYSRIYWYEFDARSDGFFINTSRVRFAILNDGNNVVRAALNLPTDYERSDKIKALGTYDVKQGQIENLVCF